MPLSRDSGFQFAIVKEILDPNAQKRQIEEKIKAVEEWNKLLDEKAARQEIETYKQLKPNSIPIRTLENDRIAQLSLKLDELAPSTVDHRS
jgi:DNA-binding transcriptional MerR regulator